MSDLAAKGFSKLHVGMLRASGGRVGGTMQGQKIVVLTTTGQRSGKPRVKPLVGFEHEGALYVGASYNGAPTNPAWFTNLAANPNVTVAVDGREHTAVTQALQGAERDKIWAVMVGHVSAYEKAQDKTTRVIPVVRLDVQP
jgi:deazaflavin-dependent oxidoreductase (nitroreductase family)